MDIRMSKRVTRIKVGAALRDKLLVQVGHRCVRCLFDTPEVDVHHMVPVAKGGTNAEDNLIVLCPNCHRLAHRYKLSVRQLREYKKQAVQGRRERIRLWRPDAEPFPDDDPDASFGSSSAELIPILQSKAEGWYNQLVHAAAASLKGGTEAEVAEFEYTHSRFFLPHIIAMRNRFEARKELPDVVSDIDVLLSLLTEVEINVYGGG